MKCSRCQAESPPGTKFCGQCAAPVVAVCASCGAGNPPGNKYCGQCGTRLDQLAQPRFAPESYTPRHLVEKILTSKAALEGERKQVTVLFADLKGSMELLADRDPEDARKILDPVLEHMMEAVHRYEGTVNQVMGDGIMALFGAPLAHEDHAVRACYAALRMQESVKQYARDVRRSHAAVVKIRVGLNSGEVVVRAIGSDLHMDYTAVGQTTHLAARMEQLADPGAIVLTPDTLALAEGYVEARSLGPVPIKGLTDPMEIYEITGVGPARTRLQAATRRGLTRFVGRDGELEQLRRAQQLAGTGRGQVAALVGEAGVGKSRLIHEFTHSHRLQGGLVIESASISYGKATSYLPVIELLKHYFKIEDRDDLREIRAKVTGKLLTLDRGLEPTLPALLWLLDVPVDDPAWQRLDPPQRRQQTLEAVKRLLLRESQVQPLIVVFEDLHWVDAETEALLATLIDSLPTARVLLLVTYRPEYQHAWSGKMSYRQLRIDPLPAPSADELLEALVGNDAGLAALKPFLIERAAGNPFFLEESVRTLVETKLLTGERGAYRVAQTSTALDRARRIPASAQALLAARIDRLSPERKRLLQAASVVGTDVPFVLLHAIADERETELRQGLAELQASEFLYETRLFPELEYTFKHALTHEVAYASLLQERRRMLHARLVEAIETSYPERLLEHVERLADHALKGEVWTKATAYLRRAGTKAFARSANTESVAHLAKALEALRHLPESRESVEDAIDIRLDLRNSLIPLGELGRIFDYLREADTLARALGDQRRLGWVYTFMTNYFWHAGEHDRAVESGQRALAIATAIEDHPLRAEANFRLGQACHPLGDYRRAIEFLRSSVEGLPGELAYERLGGSGVLSVFARTWLLWCLAEIGGFAEGIAQGQEAIRIAESVDHPYTLVHAEFGVGLLHLRRGDIDGAISVLERGVALCRVAAMPGPFPVVAAQLALAYALAGRIGEALPLLTQVTERAESMRLRWGNVPWVVWLTEASLLADRLEEATHLASRNLVSCREHKESGQEAWLLYLLGEIASRRGVADVEGSETHYRQAMSVATGLGMRPLVAHCHLGLGKLCRRTGKPHRSHEHLTRATTMYLDMDMRFWLERAETALGA